MGGWGPGTSLGAKVPDSAALITTQASFLPGVGGKWGVPMWAFYVNRGQGMATFGVETKDGGISLFQTAEKTYQVTPFVGFRTLLKGTRASGTSFESQPFMPSSDANPKTTPDRKMMMGYNEMEVEENAAGSRGSADDERPVREEKDEDFAGACAAACDIHPPAPEMTCDF